jgi:hypothetical protein
MQIPSAGDKNPIDDAEVGMTQHENQDFQEVSLKEREKGKCTQLEQKTVRINVVLARIEMKLLDRQRLE